MHVIHRRYQNTKLPDTPYNTRGKIGSKAKPLYASSHFPYEKSLVK